MRKSAIFFLSPVLSISTCFAETNEGLSAVKEVKFNYGILTTERDASMFVHSLELLNSGKPQGVAALMEHKLDEIVCGVWGQFDEMNGTQQTMIMQQLQGIKAYREKHPRNADLRVGPREFSDFFSPFDDSLANCADEVLAKLP